MDAEINQEHQQTANTNHMKAYHTTDQGQHQASGSGDDHTQEKVVEFQAILIGDYT